MKTRMAMAIVALATGATALQAQESTVRPEIRPFGGALMATGVQRALFQDAPILGVQAALEAEPFFHVLATFSWVPGHTRFVVRDPGVNILDYNSGVEFGFVRPLGGKWQISPFAGLGAGARTYLYSGAGLADKTCTTAYAALGTEFQLGHTALRLEARGSLLGFRSPVVGVEWERRSDVGIVFGVAYHIR